VKAETKLSTCTPVAAIRNNTTTTCLLVSFPLLRHTAPVPKGHPSQTNTMNRLPTLDPHVLTIADLKEAACRDMPAMYRGSYDGLLTLLGT
jgi:hypothetical protein